MNGNKLKVLGAGGILAIAVACLQLWTLGSKVLAEKHEADRQAVERLNDMEMRLCALEGGRWRRGDCVRRTR